ncbi:MAG TPA: glutaredoxin family protein [Bacteroidetes bacterium]|jgi:hypothetical protein|nr:glutaredoxin family protein [Bacteroidota bacterium]
MTLVEIFSKEECHLCDDARAVINKVQQDIPFRLREFKLMPGDPYYEEYREWFPVVHINKALAFKYRVNENMFKIKLQQVAGDARNPNAEPDEPSIGSR